MAAPRILPSADLDDGVSIGEGTSVWHLAQVRGGAEIGENVVVGRGAYIGSGVHVGNNCKIQNYALVYEPAHLEDGVFKKDDPREVAKSLKRSAEKSDRRKSVRLPSMFLILRWRATFSSRPESLRATAFCCLISAPRSLIWISRLFLRSSAQRSSLSISSSK